MILHARRCWTVFRHAGTHQRICWCALYVQTIIFSAHPRGPEIRLNTSYSSNSGTSKTRWTRLRRGNQ